MKIAENTLYTKLYFIILNFSFLFSIFYKLTSAVLYFNTTIKVEGSQQ